MRVVIKSFWVTVVVALVSLAFVVSLARLTLPIISEYKHDIEVLIEQSLGQALSIEKINAKMHGINPSLHLLNVSMLDEETSKPLLLFDEVHVDIDILASLKNWRPELGNLTLVGLDLTVERNSQEQIVVAGVKGAPKENLSTEQGSLGQWFLSQERLLIEQATIRWVDNLSGLHPQVFAGLNFTLINAGGRNQIVGHGFLPGRLGGEFDFAFDLRGTAFGGKATGDGYVHTIGAKLSPWQSWLFKDAVGYEMDARVDLKAFMSWSRGKLERIDAEVAGYDMIMNSPEHSALAFDALKFAASWREVATGWDLVVRDFKLDKEETPGLVGRGADHGGLHIESSGMQYRVTDSGSQFELGVSSFDATWVSEIAQRLPFSQGDWGKALAMLKPQAEVTDFYLRQQVSVEANTQFFMRAQLHDVALSRFEKIPEISGVDGILYVDNQGWVFDAATENASIDLNGLFRDPFVVSQLNGVVVGSHKEGEWEVWSDHLAISNEHLAANTYFFLQQKKGAVSPELDLVASVDRADARYTSRYLPVGIMHEKVVSWLDSAILEGKVAKGGITFRGPVKSFPFDQRDGRFEVQVSFEQGKLVYGPGWPPIVDMKGQLIFNEQSMLIRGKSAKTLGSRLSNVIVTIPKFKSKKRALYVEGRAKGPTSDGVLFLTTTPLLETVGKVFVGARAGGQGKLDFSLRLPLNADESQITLNGKTQFFQSDLQFKGLGVDLTEVDGILQFTEKGINADKLRGKVMGLVVEAKLATETVESNMAVVVEGNGFASTQDLFRLFKVPVFKDMHGEVPWFGRLLLPKDGDIALTIRSALNGVAIDIPAPVGKLAEEVRDTQVELRFPFSAVNPVRIKYGDELSSVFELASEQGTVKFRRGEIRYADGNARLPKGSGLRLVGKTKVYNHAQWMAYVARLNEGSGSGGEGAVIAELDFIFEEALIFGQKLRDVSFEMVKAERGLLGVIKSPDAAGHMAIPANAQSPTTIDLEYFYYQPYEENAAESKDKIIRDPRTINSLRLNVQSFYYDKVPLGRLTVELAAETDGSGVAIRRADLVGDYLVMRSNGSWRVTGVGSAQQTVLNAMLDSQDVGKLLGLLGYLDNIKHGEVHSELRLEWQGGAGDFALEVLKGEGKFEIRSGVLLDVDPGAGRIFGLLSVQALPRRLSLDFSDLFSKGLAFDSIRGEIKLNEGEAFTEDLKLEGPAGNISVTGYIDLIGKKYNQYVTVEPNLTGSLPLAIAVIANPAAGVAAWFAEKLLRRPVSDIAKILYHVTGRWESPDIRRLGRLEYFQQQQELLSK